MLIVKMNRSGLFQAMEGKKEPMVSKLTTRCEQSGEGSSTNVKVMNYRKEPKAPQMLNKAIDMSTRRNVLPCKGITITVGRTPYPFPKPNGLFALGGQSRTQAPSMVNPRPLNLPIQIPRSSVDASRPTKIAIPGVA